MQKIPLITFFIISIPLGLWAQTYEFALAEAPYESLENPDFVTTDTSGGILYSFHFPFSEKQYHAFGQELTEGFSAGTNGFLLANSTTNGFTFDPFLADLKVKVGISELRVRERMGQQDSILEIEWYKFGINEHPDEDFVTFKLSLFRATGAVEFHYGPSLITKENAFKTGQRPIVVISYLSQDYMNVHRQYFVSGQPKNPEFLEYPNFNYISGFPSENTQYVFYNPSSAIPKKELPYKMSLYPNPTNSVAIIECNKPIESYTVESLDGKQMLAQNCLLRKVTLDASALRPGIYLLRLNLEDGSRSVRQLIVE